MGTRVSPRSNASSASSSSSASRRVHRNSSFNRDRDNSEPWVTDGRGAYPGKQQHQHQQHSKGQWGHMYSQANRHWGNSGAQFAGNNYEDRLSWRSQKQAVDNFSSYLDGGQPRGGQQSYRAYEPSPCPLQGQPAFHSAKDYRNQGALKEQNFSSDQSRPVYIAERSPWRRHEPKLTTQGHFVSGKGTHGYNSPASNINHSRGSGGASKFHEGSRSDPLIRSPGFGGYTAPNNQVRGDYSGNFSQRSRHTSETFNQDVVNNSVNVNRGWSASTTSRDEDNFPPLTNGNEAGARNVQVVSTSANRVWGNAGASIGSWADECGDDTPQSCLKDEYFIKSPPILANSNKGEWERSSVSGYRKPNASDNYNFRATDSSASNRDTRRQNIREGSNTSVAGNGVQSSIKRSWRNQESSIRQGQASRNQDFSVKQGEANMNTTLSRQDESFKCTMSLDSEQAGDSKKSGTSMQNQIYHEGCKIEEETMSASEDQVFTTHGDSEFLDDVKHLFIIGMCEDMCPVKERKQRERLRDLAVFERVSGNPGRTSRELAVKKFCRTFSGVKLLPADFRPLRILWSTLQYLLNLLDDSEFSFDVVHNFLFDRTRAIRQELGMQRIANSQAINMYEEIVRFHILSERELNRRCSGRHVSNSHLNLEQLSKSLLSLVDLYNLNRHEKLANEAEFRAYYVLLNLDSNRHHQADSLSVWFRQCPASLLNAWELKFARVVLRCYRSWNYKKFFRLAEEATFLQSCLMELHFNEVRLKSLAAMNQGGYKLHPIPLSDIAKHLLIKISHFHSRNWRHRAWAPKQAARPFLGSNVLLS